MQASQEGVTFMHHRQASQIGDLCRRGNSFTSTGITFLLIQNNTKVPHVRIFGTAFHTSIFLRYKFYELFNYTVLLIRSIGVVVRVMALRL